MAKSKIGYRKTSSLIESDKKRETVDDLVQKASTKNAVNWKLVGCNPIGIYVRKKGLSITEISKNNFWQYRPSTRLNCRTKLMHFCFQQQNC